MLKNEYIDLIMDNPVKIGQWLGFTDLTDIHNEWLKDIILGREDKTILAHRGSYKTTCLSVGIPLGLLLFPNRNKMFMRKTDTDTKEIMTQMEKVLLSDTIQHLAYKIYNQPLKLTQSNSSELTTNLYSSARGTSQIFAMGTKGSLTGKHFDDIITDDIVNIKDRSSRAEREFTKSIYMELQNIKNRGGRILNTGTPWHKEDCISIMPNVSKFDCYQTGLIGKAELIEIRSKMTSSLFAANYELKHIASEDVLFDSPNFTDNYDLIHNGICHIDASYGGEDGTAFTIIKKRGDKYYVFGKRWKKHVDNCITEILGLVKYYMGGIICTETNGDKGYLAKELHARGATVHKYHEDTNKFIKISSIIKPVWKNIYFLDNTDREYIDEICDYNEQAEHDDSPDSLASIIRKASRTPRVERWSTSLENNKCQAEK